MRRRWVRLPARAVFDSGDQEPRRERMTRAARTGRVRVGRARVLAQLGSVRERHARQAGLADARAGARRPGADRAGRTTLDGVLVAAHVVDHVVVAAPAGRTL